MNQSCFILGFLSQNSLWKLSFICGYKGYLNWGEKRMWNVRVFKTGVARGLTESRVPAVHNRTASCPILSCSAPASMTLRLLACLAHVLLLAVWSLAHVLLLAAWSRKSLFSCTLLSIQSLYLTHYPHNKTHLNTGLLNAEIQANLAWNKANKMVD